MSKGASGFGVARRPWTRLGALLLAATPAVTRADIVSANGSMFNPADAAFTAAHGSLTLTSGNSITLNTDDGTITGLPAGANVGGNFYLVKSQSQTVELGMFVFDSISLPQGVSVSVTGKHGLVLGSRGNFDLGTTLQLNGGNAPTLSGFGSGTFGAGAPGSDSGTPNGTPGGAPPSTTHGNGGQAGYGSSSTSSAPGVGAGGGASNKNSISGNTVTAGGGGGYGGKGGQSQSNSSFAGAFYGEQTLARLFGGSGGGGAHLSSTTPPTNASLTGGGGGGGALELISLGTLTLTGTVEAKGGNGGASTVTSGKAGAGGGGSGGGILVAARSLNFAGSVNANGGANGALSASLSGSSKFEGGAGGGGRVAFYYNTLAGSLGSNITVAGGKVGTAGFDGAVGTVYDAGPASFPFQPVAGPELSSFTLMSMGLAPVLLRRRRPRRNAETLG